MSFIKITVCICLQNFRKWQKDYRIWTIAAILFILILENTRKFSDLSADLGVFVFYMAVSVSVFAISSEIDFYAAAAFDVLQCTFYRSKRIISYCKV